MELVRNKASNKHFIVLDDDNEGIDFLLITPEGKIMRLERRLFDSLGIVDPKNSRWRNRLTEQQFKKYEEYFDK